jgi:CheY-like chemotaxis protein
LSDRRAIEVIGFAGYLAKPIRQDRLKNCLSLVLGCSSPGQAAETPAAVRQVVAEEVMLNKRVLLAEDNPVNQMVAVALLKKLGLAVDVVANGSEALSALEQIPYDLVLMDCQMPVMDGYEATRLIRDPLSKVLNHAVPVAAMTANAMQGDREKCLAAGMNDYTRKPVNLVELKRVVSSLLSPDVSVTSEYGDTCASQSEVPCDFEEMLDRFEGDREFVSEIFAISRQDLPLRLEELHRCLNRQERESAQREAHTIKGIAANICANPAKAAAEALEKGLGGGSHEQVTGLLAELETRIAVLVTALEQDCG